MDKTKEAILSKMGYNAAQRERIERINESMKPKPLPKWNYKK